LHDYATSGCHNTLTQPIYHACRPMYRIHTEGKNSKCVQHSIIQHIPTITTALANNAQRNLQ